MSAVTYEKIIRKYIGNIGNTPSTNRAIENLAYVLSANSSIQTKAQVLFSIEVEIGNPHKRTDLKEVFNKLADDLLIYKEKKNEA